MGVVDGRRLPRTYVGVQSVQRSADHRIAQNTYRLCQPVVADAATA